MSIGQPAVRGAALGAADAARADGPSDADAPPPYRADLR